MALGLGRGPGLLLKLFRERYIVEEDIGIVEFAVPGSFQIGHGLEQLAEFLIADKGDECGIGAGRLFAIGGVIVFVGSP